MYQEMYQGAISREYTTKSLKVLTRAQKVTVTIAISCFCARTMRPSIDVTTTSGWGRFIFLKEYNMDCRCGARLSLKVNETLPD